MVLEAGSAPFKQVQPATPLVLSCNQCLCLSVIARGSCWAHTVAGRSFYLASLPVACLLFISPTQGLGSTSGPLKRACRPQALVLTETLPKLGSNVWLCIHNFARFFLALCTDTHASTLDTKCSRSFFELPAPE